MATTIGKLSVILSASAGGFLAAMDQCKAAAVELGATVAVATGGISVITGVVAAAGAGISAFVGDAISATSETRKMAAQLGLSVEAFSAFQFAGESSKLTAEEVGMALRKMTTTLGKEGVGGDPIQHFMAIADQIAAIPDPMLQAGKATEFFGNKMATKLLPFLQKGSAGIVELMNESSAMGATLSSIDAGKLGAAAGALHRVRAALSGLTASAAATLAPLVTKVAELVGQGLKTLRPFFDLVNNAVAGWVDGLMASIGTFTPEDVINGLQFVAEAVVAFANSGIEAVTNFANFLIQSGVGAFNTLVANAGTAGDSLIGAFATITSTIANLFIGLVENVMRAMAKMGGFAMDQFGEILNNVPRPLLRLLGLDQVNGNEIRVQLQGLQDSAFEDLGKLRKEIYGGINDGAQQARDMLKGALPGAIGLPNIPGFTVPGVPGELFDSLRGMVAGKAPFSFAGVPGPKASTPDVLPTSKLPEALKRGSAEAVSFLNRYRSGGDEQERRHKESVAALEKIQKGTDKIGRGNGGDGELDD